MTGTPFKAIAAMAQNRVIGCGSDIPWHLPEDFKWFKQTTLGNILAMGRKTFESIGRPLPGRTTYVLSRSPISIEGVHCNLGGGGDLLSGIALLLRSFSDTCETIGAGGYLFSGIRGPIP